MHFLNISKLGLCAAAVLSAVVIAKNTDFDDGYVDEYHDTASVEERLQKRRIGVSTASDASLQALILNVHNSHRVYHHAGNLTWDSTLTSYAQNWVNRCQFQHSGGPYGENLYAIFPGPSGDWPSATTDAQNAWVYEVKDYDYDNPGFSSSTGHFTQFVWKGTQKVGCAWNTVDCTGQAIFMCEYSPAGNIIGYFPGNVLPP